MTMNDFPYFGKEAYEQYGAMVVDALKGRMISKRKDRAEEGGGLLF